MIRRGAALLACCLLAWPADWTHGMAERPLAAPKQAHHPTPWISMFVTGYDDTGVTATGTQARWGEVAVDPRTIHLGWWVRVKGLGVFHAEDTGGLVRGNHLDIWEPTVAQCYAITGYYLARVARTRRELR